MGIRVLMGAIMLIAFSIILLVPAGAQSAFAGLSVAPTCTIGNYNADSNQCEAPTTVAPTCPDGYLLNTSTDICELTPPVEPTCPDGLLLNKSTDLCEGTTTVAPTCTIGTLDTLTDMCVDQTCFPDPVGCIPFDFGPPDCPTGFNYNTVSNFCDIDSTAPICPTGLTYNIGSDLCELEGASTIPICDVGPLNFNTDMCEGRTCLPEPIGCFPISSSPSCNPGLSYNTVSNLCDIVTTDLTCTIGNYNTASNQCEGTTTSTPICPDGFTLNTSTDLCESPFEEDPGVPIGGTLIPIDSASLFLVGAQMTTSWLIPVIVSAVGIVLVFVRKSEKS